jgi:hypothetical protein
MPFKEFFAKKKTCDFVANITGELVAKYNHFREFLEFNRDALTQLAGWNSSTTAAAPSWPSASNRQLLLTVGSGQALNGMGGGYHRNLLKACERVEQNCCLIHSGPCCLIGDLVLPLSLA